MFKHDLLTCLPSAEELPDSDDTPVDNNLQNLIPNLLDGVLALIWKDRNSSRSSAIASYRQPQLCPHRQLN